MRTQQVTRTREQRWSERLTVPVLVAALVSVPAVFLTLMDDPYSSVGSVANLVSGAVLTGETLILLAVAEDKRAWVRKNLWLIGLTVLVVLAVVFALGPAQLLRLVRTVGALRVVRAGRILKAARILARRAGLTGWWTHVLAGAVGVLVAGFVAVLLADPTSSTRSLVESWLGGTPAVLTGLVVLAGVLLGGATFVVLRDRGEDDDTTPDDTTAVDTMPDDAIPDDDARTEDAATDDTGPDAAGDGATQRGATGDDGARDDATTRRA